MGGGLLQLYVFFLFSITQYFQPYDTLRCVDFDDLNLSFVYPNRFSYVSEDWAHDPSSPSRRDSKDKAMRELQTSESSPSNQSKSPVRASSNGDLELGPIQEKANLIEVGTASCSYLEIQAWLTFWTGGSRRGYGVCASEFSAREAGST